MGDLIRFKQLIEENKKADEINSNLKDYEKLVYGQTKYNFLLCYSLNTIMSPKVTLLKLDDDDIDYLYNKYVSDNLDNEYENKINEIKRQYGRED